MFEILNDRKWRKIDKTVTRASHLPKWEKLLCVGNNSTQLCRHKINYKSERLVFTQDQVRESIDSLQNCTTDKAERLLI